MTTKARKILITTESREKWIVRRGGKKSLRGFCPHCAAEAEMLSLDDAVDFFRLPVRDLIRQTQSGAVHGFETGKGHLLICRKSLQNFLHPESNDLK